MNKIASSAEIFELANTQNYTSKSLVLKAAFSAHNRHVSAGSIKESINSKQDISSMAAISELVGELGFEATAVKVSKKTELEVLENIVCLFDGGGLGLLTVTKNDTLVISFNGRPGKNLTKAELLVLKKVQYFIITPKFETNKNVKDRIRLLNPFSSMGGLNFFWIALATATSNILGLATSIFIMVVYDRVLPNQADQSLYALAAGVGLAIIFDQIFKAARGSIIEQSAVYKDKRSNDDIFEQFVETKTDLTKRSIGSLSTITRDYETYKEFVSSAGLALFIDLPFIFIFIFVIYYIGDQLYLVPLIAVPLVIVGIFIVQPFLLRSSKRVSQVNQSRQGLLVEILIGLDALRVNGAYALLRRKFNAQADNFSLAANRAKKLSQVSGNYVNVIQQLAQIAIIVFGFHLFVNQQISMGAIIATMILSGKTLAPLAKIAQTLGRANSAYVARKNLIEFFSQKRRERFSNTGLQQVSKETVLDVTNVSIKLSPESKPIFNNLTFKVKEGEKIAIIGKSGAGKTTLLRALCGLIEAETGTIQVNGDQVSSIPRDEICKSIGVVLQESWLFSGTLRENLTFGYDEYSDDELAFALDAAGAHFLGENSQEMLEFPILDRGSNLSGGQKQVICTARALLQKPSVLLLDEATSALDAQMEMAFLKYLSKNELNQTILAVTHKPNVIGICDRVMIVDAGQITWDGSLSDYRALLEKRKNQILAAKQEKNE